MACGEKAPPAEPPEKLKVIFPAGETGGGFWQDEVSAFEHENNVEIEFISTLSWDEIKDLVQAAVRGGSDEYDVVEFDNGWVAEFLQAGYLEPLDNWVPAGLVADLLPGQRTLYSHDGKLYGIVWANDTRFFMYNRSVLEAGGFDHPPATFEELRTQCAALETQSLVEHCLFQNWYDDWQLVTDLHFFTYGFGKTLVDSQANIVWNNPTQGSVQALEYMQQLARDGHADPAGLEAPTTEGDRQQMRFLQGQTAFILTAPAAFYAASQDTSISQVAGKVGIALAPGAAAGLSAEITLPEALAIPVNSKHKELAGKLIAYLSSPETVKRLVLRTGVPPSLESLYADPDILQAYPHFQDFDAQLATARSLTLVSWYDALIEALGPAVRESVGSVNRDAKESLDVAAAALSAKSGTP